MEEKNKERSLEQAIDQYRQVAQEGDVNAQHELAKSYYQHGEYSKSLYWWEKAAEAECNAAYVRLAIQYAYGMGTEKDEKKALDYIWKAVKKDPTDADALCHLGMFYEGGIGLEASMEQALTCYRQAAEMGSAIAHFTLGMCYFSGHGVEENPETALEWVDKSAEMSCPEGQYFMGLQYYLGDCVTRDLTRAVRYLKAGAENGSVDARQLLPVVEKDIGIERQMSHINGFSQMLDEYEAYMRNAVEQLGCDDEA